MTSLGSASNVNNVNAVVKANNSRIELESEQKNGSSGSRSADANNAPGLPKEEKSAFDISKLKEEEKKKLEEELKKMNDSLVFAGKMLKFKYNDEAKETYVEVIDAESQEVVASLPPEFLIDLSIKMKDLIGMFIDKRI